MPDDAQPTADGRSQVTESGDRTTGHRVALTAVVLAAVLILGWWLFTRGRGEERIDLIASFDTAQKRPDASVFTLAEVTLKGETKRSIAVEPALGTRLTYRIRVPDDGWLHVALGVKEEAWQKQGDGVTFMVGISDGRAFDELFTQHVNPFGDSTNRRWIPVYVDISAYGGEEVDLIMNTLAAPPRQDGTIDNDYAVWGAPEIVVR
jgi:hypothetical protein